MRLKTLTPVNSFVLLPSARTRVPSAFRQIETNHKRHRDILAAVQRFRGSIYLGDGAITAGSLTTDGRHESPCDHRSWHVASMNPDGRVVACLRFMEESTPRHIEDLWRRNAAIADCSIWGSRVRLSVAAEMQKASRLGMAFGEVGGWAIAPERRCTTESLQIILATYGLLQLLGGCMGVATATTRHGSASVLRRLGLSPLQVDSADLPPYYDPGYGCIMELLRFDSRCPNPKYTTWVAALVEQLAAAPVVCLDDQEPLDGRETSLANLQALQRHLSDDRLPVERVMVPVLAGERREAVLDGVR